MKVKPRIVDESEHSKGKPTVTHGIDSGRSYAAPRPAVTERNQEPDRSFAPSGIPAKIEIKQQFRKQRAGRNQPIKKEMHTRTNNRMIQRKSDYNNHE